MRDDKADDELQEIFEKVDSDAYLDLIDDLALAEQVLEDYEAHGIERTTPYTEYRAKRLGSNTSMRA